MSILIKSTIVEIKSPPIEYLGVSRHFIIYNSRN